MRKPRTCEPCPLYSQKMVPYEQGTTNKVMLVGEAPFKEEVMAIPPRPFVGKAGKILNSILAVHKLNRGDMFIANAMRCFLDKKVVSREQIKEAMRCCRPLLMRAIIATSPKLIVGMGDIAMSQLIGKVAASGSISSMRGKLHMDLASDITAPIFLTFHPAYIGRGMTKGYPNKPYTEMNSNEKVFYKDFEYIATYVGRKFSEPALVLSGYTEHSDDAEEDAQRFIDSGTFAYDLETVSKENSTILCMSVSNQPGRSSVYFYNNPKGRKAIKKIARAKCKKYVAARPFDERLLEKHGIITQGVHIDVLTMAHVIDENYYRFNLETVADVYAGMKEIKRLSAGMREDLGNAEKEVQVRYAGVDADATMRSARNLKDLLRAAPKLGNYYAKLVVPVQDMFREIEGNGVLIDKEILQRNQDEAVVEMARLEREAVRLIPRHIREAHAERGLSLSRDQLIADTIFNGFKVKPDERYFLKKTGRYSVCHDHLKMFSRLKFVKVLFQYNDIEKVYSSYLKNMWQHIREDGRIYPSTYLTSTVTGRTAMRGPAAQTIPQRKPVARLIKEAIVADRDWLFLARDLSQSELRIMGWLANDQNILNALKKGIDLHTLTGSRMARVAIDKVTKDIRRKAKGVNFGLIYGMSAKGLKDYLYEQYDIVISDAEADSIRTLYFSRPDGFWGLVQYYDAVTQELIKNGYVESVLGRRRRLPLIYSDSEKDRSEAIRMAINFKGQGPSSDFGLIGMFLFHRAVKKERHLRDRVKPLWFIHDNDLIMAHKDVKTPAMELLKDCMENRMVDYVKAEFGVRIGYPVVSDGKEGTSWANMTEL